MDYVFIKSEGDFEDNLKNYFFTYNMFGEVKVEIKSEPIHFAAFLGDLGMEEIPKPIGRIYIASHANRLGTLSIDLDTDLTNRKVSRPGYTFFDDIVLSIKDGSLLIPKSFVQRADGSVQTPFTIEIVGCNYGKARIVVDKLREAFGKQVSVEVVAPLHFVVCGERTYGSFLYYVYEFFVLSEKVLKTKEELVAKFVESKFEGKEISFHDGSIVSESYWQSIIPDDKFWGVTSKNIESGSYSNYNAIHSGGPLTYTMTNKINRKSQVKYKSKLDFNKRVKKFKITNKTVPVGLNAELVLIRNYLKTKKSYMSKWPVYKYYGFDSLEGFIIGITWTFTQVGNDIEVKGVFYEYRIKTPVVNLKGDRELFFKYRSFEQDETITNYTSNNAAEGLFYVSKDGT